MFRNNVLTTRRETTDIWQSQNPILDDMELGVEIVLKEDRTISHYNIKLGDGVTPWQTLEYFYEQLNDEDTNEILDDFTINLATRKPVANRIPIYDDDAGLKSGKEPTEDDDVIRLKDLSGSSEFGTATPTAGKLAKYNDDKGLKSGKAATENNDVLRFLEFNNEVSDINSRISTLTGAYYVLDAYNFGKTLDVLDPDDVTILNTYTIANTPGASSMADVYDNTVIINEFDTSEFVYNKISELWVKYPNGYLTIATNDHLGVVKGTQPPTDPNDKSKDAYVQVLADGTMRLVRDRLEQVFNMLKPVGSGYVQHLNDPSPADMTWPGTWEIWSGRADAYRLSDSAPPSFSEYTQGANYAAGDCVLWHLAGDDYRLYTAKAAITGAPEYLDPVKWNPVELGDIVERRFVQAWTDADLSVGSEITSGDYAGKYVIEVIVSGGKFWSVEGGFRPPFVSGGRQDDRIRNMEGNIYYVSYPPEKGGVADGVFTVLSVPASGASSGGVEAYTYNFKASRVVRTGDDNAPVNLSTRFWRRVA
jgi:hypothetical protein